MIECVSESSEGAILNVRVIPRARRTGLDGIRGSAVLIRLAAAPVDGAANDALIALLAAALGVPRRTIQLLAGAKSRDKRLLIAGFAPHDVADRLNAAVDRSSTP